MSKITVELNGEKKTIAPGKNIEQAILEWDLSEQQFAIAVNESFIPQSKYKHTILLAGDRIELLVPMQGG